MNATKSISTGHLACPECLAELQYAEGVITCTECNHQYSVIEGIPCFAPTDSFYDAYADEHCPYAPSPSGLKEILLRFLPFWSWREWQFWRRSIPACGRLLDIGCGRGRELFTQKAREIMGFDGSLTFGVECAMHYDFVAVGPLPLLPFQSGMFDVVVSSHVMGHVPVELKTAFVEEISRVLRPGGITAHVIETDSDHPAVVAAKEKPEAYHEQFVSQHGHIGLEYADSVIRRFESNGFRLRRKLLVDAVLPSVLNFRTIFQHPEFEDLPGLTWTHRFDRWIGLNPIFNLSYEFCMGIFHRTFEQWFGRMSDAQFILVEFEKRSTDKSRDLVIENTSRKRVKSF